MTIQAKENPIDLLRFWYQDAEDSEGIVEASVITLATYDRQREMPCARIVLVKDISDEGVAFYTNLGSDKALQLRDHPNASLCLHWMSIGKQIRIEGSVRPVSEAEADEYFSSRPRESNIGAWASRQSQLLDSRETLVAKVAEFEKQFEGRDVPRPEFWSGYRLYPNYFDFWLRGEYRLHERRAYTLEEDGKWSQEILYP